jgi:hypothetical protein
MKSTITAIELAYKKGFTQDEISLIHSFGFHFWNGADNSLYLQNSNTEISLEKEISHKKILNNHLSFDLENGSDFTRIIFYHSKVLILP